MNKTASSPKQHICCIWKKQMQKVLQISKMGYLIFKRIQQTPTACDIKKQVHECIMNIVQFLCDATLRNKLIQLSGLFSTMSFHF